MKNFLRRRFIFISLDKDKEDIYAALFYASLRMKNIMAIHVA